MYGSLSPNAVSLIEEMFDFTRCERPNGTAYGTAGKCRKGTEKRKDYPYAAAVTQGRFNIPHSGHAKLIKHLLEKAPVAYVILGTGKENVNKDFRAQMLRAVLRKEGVDPNRVQILRGTRAASTLKDLAEKEGKDNVLFMLGADQQKFLDSIGKSLGVQTGVVPRNAKGASSSAIRRMIDSGDTEGLGREFNNDPYLVRLAQVARKVEKEEFSESFDFTRCRRPNGTYYGTKGKCKKGVEDTRGGEKLFSKGKDVDLKEVERKAEEWRKKAGLSASPDSVDWKHDRVHALVHDFLGGDDAVGKWLGTKDKSPTPAEETLVNMVHRAAALRGRGDSPDFTDRDLTRYFTRDIQVCQSRGQIPDRDYKLYYSTNKDGVEMPDAAKFIAKYREMEKTPGFDKLLDASHAMWTEAGDLLL